MRPHHRMTGIALVLALSCCFGSEAPGAPEAAVRLSRQQTVITPDALEWLYTLDGLPVDGPGTTALRVSLSQRSGRSITASLPLTPATTTAAQGHLRLRLA